MRREKVCQRRVSKIDYCNVYLQKIANSNFNFNFFYTKNAIISDGIFILTVF